MRLVTPALSWRTAFVAMAREYADDEASRYALALNDFDAYLRRLEERGGNNVPEGWLRSSEFWLEHDGEIVGCVRLRPELNAEFEHEGGHIGYDVRPSKRRMGYGTALLRLALVEARAQGVDPVLVTCDADNLGSKKVIEHNGGVLAGKVTSMDTGVLVRRYWMTAK